MQSVRKEEAEVSVLLYPCLMAGTDGKSVVLFIAPGRGTVVHFCSTDEYHLGYSCNTWNMDRFVPFKGQILLSND